MTKKNKTHQCEGCGKKLSKSGYYKHRKNCPDYQLLKNPPEEKTTVVEFSEDPGEIEIEEIEAEEQLPEDERPDWFDFDAGIEEGVTEEFPTALKWAASGATQLGKNPSKEQIQAMHDTNLQILIAGLGGVDLIIQGYGRAVTLDKELTVKHSTSDKEMVAHAQYNWLLEKGVNPSDFVSTGMIATALTGYYIVPPLVKIRKKSKVKFLKGAGKITRVFSKIPFIGKFFKPKPVTPNVVVDNVETID